jgi:signal transduction histidine kinase
MRHSLRWRLVAMFLLLAVGLAGTFLFGMQKALSIGWRDAARPLLVDYVDRLAAEVGSPPSEARARALVARLPLAVRISGPTINWQSDEEPVGHWGKSRFGEERDTPLLERTTADGHRVQFALSLRVWQNQPRRVGWITLAVLLALTGLAHAYVRHLLKPLDEIRDGAGRFGRGEFGEPIPLRRRDELGQLASDVNTMAANLHQMLEAKRGLLLAISHELRSPLTRARLNTELLPETPDVLAPRQALLRDLAEMRDLVTDLLESERLGQGHSALHLEPVDLAALAREVVAALGAGTGEGSEPVQTPVQTELATDLPLIALDATRIRLLLRNLLDNALRHGGDAQPGVRLSVARAVDGVEIVVRDHGAGVEASALPHLAEPFYRPDASRGRATGGVGLGLYLCRLVVLAHGGQFALRNAAPGLEVRITLPLTPNGTLAGSSPAVR